MGETSSFYEKIIKLQDGESQEVYDRKGHCVIVRKDNDSYFVEFNGQSYGPYAYVMVEKPNMQKNLFFAGLDDKKQDFDCFESDNLFSSLRKCYFADYTKTFQKELKQSLNAYTRDLEYRRKNRFEGCQYVKCFYEYDIKQPSMPESDFLGFDRRIVPNVVYDIYQDADGRYFYINRDAENVDVSNIKKFDFIQEIRKEFQKQNKEAASVKEHRPGKSLPSRLRSQLAKLNIDDSENLIYLMRSFKEDIGSLEFRTSDLPINAKIVDYYKYDYDSLLYALECGDYDKYELFKMFKRHKEYYSDKFSKGKLPNSLLDSFVSCIENILLRTNKDSILRKVEITYNDSVYSYPMLSTKEFTNNTELEKNDFLWAGAGDLIKNMPSGYYDILLNIQNELIGKRFFEFNMDRDKEKIFKMYYGLEGGNALGVTKIANLFNTSERNVKECIIEYIREQNLDKEMLDTERREKIELEKRKISYEYYSLGEEIYDYVTNRNMSLNEIAKELNKSLPFVIHCYRAFKEVDFARVLDSTDKKIFENDENVKI